MYLIDTNIWLELLLEQEKCDEVKLFLERVNPNDIHITEFSIYSIGIILSKFKKMGVFREFIADLIINSKVDVIRLKEDDYLRIIEAMGKYSLDFDDAYQYSAAKKENLKVVSFDSDFNRTPETRLSPAQIIS